MASWKVEVVMLPWKSVALTYLPNLALFTLIVCVGSFPISHFLDWFRSCKSPTRNFQALSMLHCSYLFEAKVWHKSISWLLNYCHAPHMQKASACLQQIQMILQLGRMSSYLCSLSLDEVTGAQLYWLRVQIPVSIKTTSSSFLPLMSVICGVPAICRKKASWRNTV